MRATSPSPVPSGKRHGVGQQELRTPRRSRPSHAGPGLTLRSRRGPTAGHQARSGGTRYIFTSPGLASCRRSRLTSNVRPRETRHAVLQQNQRLSAGAEQPRRGGPTGDRAPYQSTLSSVPAARSEGTKTEGSRSEQRWYSLRRPCYIGAPCCCVEGHRLQSARSAAVSSSGASAKARVEGA